MIFVSAADSERAVGRVPAAAGDVHINWGDRAVLCCEPRHGLVASLLHPTPAAACAVRRLAVVSRGDKRGRPRPRSCWRIPIPEELVLISVARAPPALLGKSPFASAIVRPRPLCPWRRLVVSEVLTAASSKARASCPFARQACAGKRGTGWTRDVSALDVRRPAGVSPATCLLDLPLSAIDCMLFRSRSLAARRPFRTTSRAWAMSPNGNSARLISRSR